jgi:hypothetical protein
LERKRFEITPKLQQAINDIIEQATDNAEVIAKSCAYFDAVYEELPSD